MRIAAGEWRPDLAPIVNQKGLIQALNMRPKAGGYGPMRGLATLPAATPMDAYPRGSISGTDSGGNGFLFAGDATKLYQLLDDGMTDQSRTAGYQLGTRDRWCFTKWGTSIFASTYNEDTQYFSLGGTDLFQDMPARCPRARHCAIVGNFLMLGNIYDPIAGTLPESISWGAIRNPFLWPEVGSDIAKSVQSDRQPLEGGGGWVQGIVSGSEVGAVFQESSIWRLDYRGGDVVFELNRVEREIGLLIPGAAAAFERQIFFISGDGFRLFDYTQSTSIGKDRVDQYFFADLDNTYLDRVWVVKDPATTTIWTLYPGAGNTGGRPNKIIIYDYALKRFSHVGLEVEALIQNATTVTLSLDSIDDPPDDPDTLGDPITGDPYNVGLTSFDDRTSGVGLTRMGGFDTTFTPADFSGPGLEGLMETGDMELAPGSRAFVNGTRPLVDSRDATVAVGTSARRNQDIKYRRFAPQTDSGDCPQRADARYHRFKMKLPIGWTEANGIDVIHVPSGDR